MLRYNAIMIRIIGALKVGHHFTLGERNAFVEEWWQER